MNSARTMAVVSWVYAASYGVPVGLDLPPS